MTQTRSNNTPFWLLLIGIVLILLSNSLLTEGMFLDGVTYACISRNMTIGLGSFWNPHYTQTIGNVFHSHPPLAFGLEALLFKAFGDHWWVEKLYSALTFLVSGILIAAIWKRTTNRPCMAWLPLLFWSVMPIVSWSATNNMLENTMTVFVLLSVWLMTLSYLKNNKIWMLLAGATLFGAFMSKGFTGLFPLVFPIIYCIFDDKRHWIQGSIDTLLLMFTLALLSGVMILAFPTSLAYIKEYFQIQVLSGLHEATVASRFAILFAWLGQVAIPIAIVAILLVVSRISMKSTSRVFEFPPDRKWFFIFLIIGLTGVLPIMLSVKQRDFYMLAALPFFALALGHLTLSMFTAFALKITPNLHKWMTLGASAILLIGIVLNLCNIGKYGRDEALIEDVKKRIAEANGRTVIEIAPEEFTNWATHAYFMRYGKISLNPTQQLNE